MIIFGTFIKNQRQIRLWSVCEAAHRTTPEALLCAKAKRQQQMFYLCKSEAAATKRTAGTEFNFTLFDAFIYFEDLSEQNLILSEQF
ncbi:hypothetical protein [Lysinibacillus sp. NPDC059133]|uniref:hypothetical protein n=1 Tax=Lysinibacillus sp. NPDC059133 TaxID=3346737 RepID=UPI0036965254